jgi:hypothetical protein
MIWDVKINISDYLNLKLSDNNKRDNGIIKLDRLSVHYRFSHYYR